MMFAHREIMGACAGAMLSGVAVLSQAVAANGVSAVKITMHLDQQGDAAPILLTVRVSNSGPNAICVDHNYSANPRLVASRRGQRIAQQWSFEGRPVPGCDDLMPGNVLTFDFDLTRLYPNADPSGVLFCYTFRWRQYQEAHERRTTACVREKRRGVNH